MLSPYHFAVEHVEDAAVDAKIYRSGLSSPRQQRYVTVATTQEKDLAIKVLRDWSKKIREDFDARNIIVSGSDEQLKEVVHQQSTMIQNLYRTQQEMKISMDTIVSKQQSSMDTMLTVLNSLQKDISCMRKDFADNKMAQTQVDVCDLTVSASSPTSGVASHSGKQISPSGGKRLSMESTGESNQSKARKTGLPSVNSILRHSSAALKMETSKDYSISQIVIDAYNNGLTKHDIVWSVVAMPPELPRANYSQFEKCCAFLGMQITSEETTKLKSKMDSATLYALADNIQLRCMWVLAKRESKFDGSKVAPLESFKWRPKQRPAYTGVSGRLRTVEKKEGTTNTKKSSTSSVASFFKPK